MIYTGHISITDKEKEYVNDALINGWDEHAGNYTKLFEERFAKYVGAKYARAVSGGTQALTLALAALGVGAGDEVILPDITYFACSDVITLLGAKPVFAEVDKYWTIDIESVKKLITPKTKAIMPVWLYGQAPDMYSLMQISKSYNIPIVEDACPAVGAYYDNKHAGTFGKFGCFSFHASKIMTTGFGGMIVTDDYELYWKMLHLADHGEDRSVAKFWQTKVGYSFDLPNIASAMGVAQLERIEDFKSKKRKVFKWYQDELKYVDGITMNLERDHTTSNYWMTSIVMEKDFKISRDGVIDRLKAKGIDSRPFFFPISNFKMYDTVQNKNAMHIAFNGINLPSGYNRTQSEIKYICDTLKDILCV